MLKPILIRRSFKTTNYIYWPLVGLILLLIVVCAWANLKANNLNGTDPVTTGRGYLESYYALYFMTFGSLVTGIVAILVPITMITKEVDNSSLAVLLVSKNPRNVILMNKMFTMIIQFLILYVIQSIGMIIVGFGIAPQSKMITPKLIDANSCYWIACFVLASFTFFLASATDRKGAVYGVTFGILIFSILISLVGVASGINFFTYISLFAFNRTMYVLNNDLRIIAGFIVGIIISVAWGIGSIYAFRDRDLML